MAGMPVQSDKGKQAEQGEYRDNDPEWNIPLDGIGHALRRRPVRRKSGRLALDVGNLLAKLLRQVFPFFRAFQQVAPLEADEQAHMEYFQGINTKCPTIACRVDLVEKVFAGQLIPEKYQLQWPALPTCPDVHLRGQNGFVNRGAKGVFAIEDVFCAEAVFLGCTLKLLKKFLDVLGELLGIFGCAALAEQNEHVEAVVKQVDQAAG